MSPYLSYFFTYWGRTHLTFILWRGFCGPQCTAQVFPHWWILACIPWLEPDFEFRYVNSPEAEIQTKHLSVSQSLSCRTTQEGHFRASKESSCPGGWAELWQQNMSVHQSRTDCPRADQGSPWSHPIPSTAQQLLKSPWPGQGFGDTSLQPSHTIWKSWTSWDWFIVVK